MTLQADTYRAVQPWTDAYANHKAESLGCTVEWAEDGELQLDIDNDADFDAFLDQLDLLKELDIGIRWRGYNVRPSRGGHRHITVMLAEPIFDMATRIMLQAFLGSDRKRELLSYAGMLKGQEHPILFFRPKERA